jgi:Do/DeqQ family serine protease
MKQFGALTMAAMLGSILTLVAYNWLNDGDKKSINLSTQTPVANVAYTLNEKGEAIPLDFTGTAEKVTKAVVHIRSTQKENQRNEQLFIDPFREFFGGPQRPMQPMQPAQSTGSGVIINQEGYIVTNNHVVNDAAIVEVTLSDNRSFKAEVIGTDPDTDLAVLKIKEKNLPFLSFVDSDKAKVGEWVLAVGNPFNLNSTVTAGIISAKGRNIGIVNREGRATSELGNTAIESFIQTDAAINPGNSGGALVDLNGGLLGINTAIASPTGAYSGYGFAVPSDIVKKIVEDLIEFGVVQRGWLGVSIVSVNNDVAKEYDLNILEGAYISAFAEKSSAKDAGLKEGDVVIKIDDTSIKTSTALIEYIGRKRPGDKVNVTVNRQGKELIFPVTLKARDGKTSVVKPEERTGFASLGIELEDADAKLLKKLELQHGIKIKNLANGRLARETDIREGFIITHVNDTPVKSVKEFNELMKKKKTGDLVILSGTYEDFPKEFNYAIRL